VHKLKVIILHTMEIIVVCMSCMLDMKVNDIYITCEKKSRKIHILRQMTSNNKKEDETNERERTNHDLHPQHQADIAS
jgi:hypothetical protein